MAVKPLKVAVVINVLRRAGAERVVCRLTQEWAKHHDVRIALFNVSTPAYAYGGQLVDLGVRPISILPKAHRLVVGASRLARFFRDYRPDRIISFMESANFPSIIAATLTGSLSRLSVSVRVDPSAIPHAYRLFARAAYPYANKIIAPSQGVLDGLINLGLPRSKLSVIRNPVVPVRRDRSSVPPIRMPYIMGAGRLHPQKGFDRLVRAFHLAHLPDHHLVVLGDGPERERLVAMAERLEITSRVHFPGTSLKIERWYHHAACFVLSSRYEGSPNVLKEAMVNGCPVVSFDCPSGPSEIVEHGVSGMLVPHDDIEALAAAISCVVNDNRLRYQLASGGQARGRMFQVDRVAPLWLTEQHE